VTVSICDDNHHVVDSVPVGSFLVDVLHDLPLDLTEELREVGRTGKHGAVDSLVVRFEDSHRAVDSLIVRVAIHVPASVHFVAANVLGDCAKAVSMELLIHRVRRHDVTHFKDRLLVLVHFPSFCLPVKRAVITNLKIAESKIDSNRHLHEPAVVEVLHKTRSHIHFKLVERN